MEGKFMLGILLTLFGLFAAHGAIPSRRPSYSLYTEEEDPTITCPPDEGNVTKSSQITHPRYCDQFVNCWNNTYVVENCNHGLMFNPNTSACDYPDNVDCEGKEVSQGNGQGEMDPLCPQQFGTFPHPNDCTKYVVCRGGNATIASCPPDSHYNPYLLICIHGMECAPDTPASSPPSAKQSSTIDPDVELPWPDPEVTEPVFTTTTESSMTTTNMPEDPDMTSSTSEGTSSSTGATSSATEAASSTSSSTESSASSSDPDTSSSSSPTSTTEATSSSSSSASSEAPPDMSSTTPAPTSSTTESWTGIFKPIIPSWPPSIRCPIPIGYLPVTGDCASLVACINGLGNLLRCPQQHHFDPEVGACVKVEEGQRCKQDNKPAYQYQNVYYSYA